LRPPNVPAQGVTVNVWLRPDQAAQIFSQLRAQPQHFTLGAPSKCALVITW
jgi:hypothetical protein